jgi:hypothetical protein
MVFLTFAPVNKSVKFILQEKETIIYIYIYIFFFLLFFYFCVPVKKKKKKALLHVCVSNSRMHVTVTN